MKLVMWAAILMVITLPTAALAGSANFGNAGGTLSGSDTGLSLTGSSLTSVVGFPGLGSATGDLGSIHFTTGALASGSLQFGGTFNAGGTFTILGNGTDGLPTGVIFQGTFTSPVTWVLNNTTSGSHSYTLTGTISGTWYTGQTDTGVTTELTVNTSKGYFNGRTAVSGGSTSIGTPVPEPGTLGLVGAGLVSLAGLLRKVKA
jgi:hypothetical protein